MATTDASGTGGRRIAMAAALLWVPFGLPCVLAVPFLVPMSDPVRLAAVLLALVSGPGALVVAAWLARSLRRDWERDLDAAFVGYAAQPSRPFGRRWTGSVADREVDVRLRFRWMLDVVVSARPTASGSWDPADPGVPEAAARLLDGPGRPSLAAGSDAVWMRREQIQPAEITAAWVEQWTERLAEVAEACEAAPAGDVAPAPIRAELEGGPTAPVVLGLVVGLGAVLTVLAVLAIGLVLAVALFAGS